MAPPQLQNEGASTTIGLIAACSAYLLWGFLPLYFKSLGETDAWIILAHRIIWAVPAVLAMLAISGRLSELARDIRRPAIIFPLLASAIVIAANWAIYIGAVLSERILEASLGYFINPLMTLALAAMLFSERFTRLQLLALTLAGLGVVNQAVVVGEAPWISLALGGLFAVYGAIRKMTPVSSRTGFAIETIWLMPIALGWLIVWPHAGTAPLGALDWTNFAMLMLAGPVTAAPLILFAIGARALKLSTIGVLQFSAPTIQFFLALAFGETFTPAHAVTFGLIWLGVGIYCASALRQETKARRAAT